MKVQPSEMVTVTGHQNLQGMAAGFRQMILTAASFLQCHHLSNQDQPKMRFQCSTLSDILHIFYCMGMYKYAQRDPH